MAGGWGPFKKEEPKPKWSQETVAIAGVNVAAITLVYMGLMDIKADIADTREELADTRKELKAEMADTRKELKGDITKLQAKVEAALAQAALVDRLRQEVDLVMAHVLRVSV